MESLVANYASSDEDDDRDQQSQSKTDAASKASSFFSSLPQPKSSSLFSSLPQSKERQSTHVNKTPIQSSVIIEEDKVSKKPSFNSKKPSSILSSLPLPKSKTLDQPHPTSDATAKRVVQFKPPSIYSSKLIDEDEDEDDEEKERLKRKQSEYQNQNSSVKSFLSSIPAPKKSASLGVLPSASGSGRRSIIENEVPASSNSSLGANSVSGKSQYVADDRAHEFGRDQSRVDNANYEPITDPSMVNYEVGSDQNAGTYVDYSSYGYGLDPNVNSGDGSSYVNYEDHNGYGDYYSASTVQGTPGMAQSWVGMPGKKRKNDIPTEIVEVNQDELMKNRPTEDKAKLTGIAFGPSYAPVSAKGKPSKLLKRKHQISSLYFDMKQKEMELAERRAKGFLTKAQTQGKYGW